MIVYTGNYDGPVYENIFPNNFYALRNRNRREGFRFVTHDAELCLTDVNYDRTQTLTVGDPAAGSGFSESNPQYVWQRLQANAEFRLLVADRVHGFFFNGGVLTAQACAARYAMRTNEIFRALVGESARWGDADREPAITRSNWVKAVTPVLTNYFPRRNGIVLNQLRARGLYPTIRTRRLLTLLNFTIRPPRMWISATGISLTIARSHKSFAFHLSPRFQPAVTWCSPKTTGVSVISRSQARALLFSLVYEIMR